MKNNFNTSIDFGSSKIRLGITDKKNLNKNFYTEKDCISNLRIKFDVDIIFQNVNPISVKKIIRHTFLDLENIYWPNLAGHTVFPVQVAVNHKIPLIIWGAHQGIDQVGMFSHTDEVEMTRKYRKEHKGRNTGLAVRGSSVAFGSFGLKATTRGRLTSRQIESARRAMTRHIKRGGRIWIRIFPDIPVSTKPAEVRQGKGKGTPEYWVARVKPGRVMFELDGVPESVARRAFELASAKLPNQTRFVQRVGG